VLWWVLSGTYISSPIPHHHRHYLPLLARYVLERNAEAPAEERLNLKGFLVGNPSTVRGCG